MPDGTDQVGVSKARAADGCWVGGGRVGRRFDLSAAGYGIRGLGRGRASERVGRTAAGLAATQAT
jgi:hypothetical protein